MCTFGITAVSKPPPTLRNEGLNHIVAQEAGIAGRLSTAAEAFFKMPISHQTQVLIGLSSCGLLAMRGNSVCVCLFQDGAESPSSGLFLQAKDTLSLGPRTMS